MRKKLQKNSEKSPKMCYFDKKKYPPLFGGFASVFGHFSAATPTYHNFLSNKKGILIGVFLRAKIIQFFSTFPSRFIVKSLIFGDFWGAFFAFFPFYPDFRFFLLISHKNTRYVAFLGKMRRFLIDF